MSATFSWLSGSNSGTESSTNQNNHNHQQQQQQHQSKSAVVSPAGNSYLRFATVDQVSNFRGSDELANILKELQYYDEAKPTSTVMLKSDPEYQFILNCGNTCVKIEQEKLKIHKFIVDHYSRRFPELCVLVQDATTYARVVSILGNNIFVESERTMEELEEWIPSQLLAAVIACTVTTKGEELPPGEMENILQACHELTSLEEVKQVILEYIQVKMIYVCRNVCAFVGTGIASQLVATAGSVDELANMTPDQVVQLGSARAQRIGFAVKTSGFLQNVDLVQKQSAELRMKAMRLVADQVLRLARVDAKREGADESQGLQGRDYVIRRILQWTDPLIQEVRKSKHGLSNKLYEKRSRISRKDRWAQAAANTTSISGTQQNRQSGARRQRDM